MSKLRLFFRAIGEGVCAKGLKAICSLVPLGEFLFEVAEYTYERMREQGQREQIAAISAAASATNEEAKHEAEAAVAEIAAKADPPLPLEAQINLVAYLQQVPAAVRQTMKRPSDPAGKTIPASFTLKKAEQLVTMLPQRLPSFKPGDRPPGVGNWELVELLGAGGFGEVWLARHPSLHGLTAALKFCLDPQAATFLRHEAALLDRVMSQTKHPGIVKLRQAYLDSTPLCLEYEYVNGGDLAALRSEWLRGGGVPRRQVNVLVQRLAEIVGHAHHLSPPIVHRDLKPANVLVERADGKVRLRVTDFGIGGIAATRTLDATRQGSTKRSEILATSLRGAHTPIYASPQQVRGDDPDPRDDVHALGVIWYQLLMGDLTTGVPSDWMMELEALGQERELINLLGTCVSSRLEKRPADASVLAQRLDAILNPPPVVLDAVVVQEEEVAVAELIEPPEPKTQRGTRRPVEDDEEEPVPTAKRVRTETQRPVRSETQRTVPAETQRAPKAQTQRGPVDDPCERPPEAKTKPAKGPAQAGNQVRRFDAPDVAVADLRRDLQDWLTAEGFNCQDLRTEDGGILIQVSQKGTWRAFVGMQTALNVILRQDGDEITVEIGAGQWLDKAAAGVVSLFILWPLAVTAAIGAWNQMKMPERVFSRVSDFVAKKQERALPAPAPSTGGLSPDRIAQLRELAALRDQGVLTDEEFQAEKARLLGR